LILPMIRRALLAILLSASAVAPLLAAGVSVAPAFGYRIGDPVVAVSDLTVDSRARLDPESLPKVGRINGWLSLQDVRLVSRDEGVRVVRTFQVTASAIEPKMLFLPKAQLRFRLADREITETLESVPISVSPLTSREPILRTGFGALRPDRDAPDPQAREARQRAQLAAALLAGLGLLWFGIRFLAMRRRGFAPFGVAAKRLRRLARRRQAGQADPDTAREAYRIMHEAFNEAAGQAVFASQKDRFLATHPRFAPAAGEVRAFFERSEEAFFAVSATGRSRNAEPARQQDPAELEWLAGVARRLGRLERPGR
jgi:mxaA protein